MCVCVEGDLWRDCCSRRPTPGREIRRLVAMRRSTLLAWRCLLGEANGARSKGRSSYGKNRPAGLGGGTLRAFGAMSRVGFHAAAPRV